MDNPTILIRILLPFYERVTAECRAGLAACLAHGPDKPLDVDGEKLAFELLMMQGSFLPELRNRLVNQDRSRAISQSVQDMADFFLCVDCDIGFTLENVVQLFRDSRAKDLQVVAGAYPYHGVPEMFVTGSWANVGAPFTRKEDHPNYTMHGLQRMDWVGAGFMLLRADLFSVLDYPWFNCFVAEDPFNGARFVVSEDIGFCHNCAENNVEIYVDLDVRVKHIPRETSKFNWDFDPSAEKVSGYEH